MGLQWQCLSHTISIVIVLLQLYLQPTLAAAPIITGLPTTVKLDKGVNEERLLYTYTITEDAGVAYTCSNVIVGIGTGTLLTSNPAEFILQQNAITSNWELRLTTDGATKITATTFTGYTNSITCTDANDVASITYDLTVTLVPGETITLHSVEGTTNKLTLNAKNTGTQTTVKTVTANSDLGHSFLYSLTSNPSYSPEFFYIDSSTGQIKTNRELKYIDAGTSTVYLSVVATDTTDQIQVYKTQTISLTNQNTIPTTTDLPLNQTVDENTAAGTTLFTMTTIDPDGTDAHTLRFSCLPSEGDTIFTLDTSGNFKINTGQTLDYETLANPKTYTCSLYIDDGIHEGGPFVYMMTVNDVNEAPTFSDTAYYGTASEGLTGSAAINPGFTCTDVDSGNTYTYDFKVANNSDRFTISSLGIISYATEYDTDASNMPTTVVLTVCCIDQDGLTGTTLLTLTITDANDNTPAFSATTYTIAVDQTTTPGSVIGTITPTDIDSGTNAEMTCAATSGSTYSSYYTITNGCDVVLSKKPDFDPGTTVGYVATATDKGSPALTGTTAIDIIYSTKVTTTTSTTAATTTPYNFWDHGANIAMFALLMLAALALLGLLAWCLARMCCGMCGGGGRGGCSNMCDCNRRQSRYPRRQVTPESPPQRKRRPPSPEVVREPPRIVEQPRPLQLVRTVARPAPAYGSWNGYGGRPVPNPGGFARSAPGGGFFR